jgi:hypothetical protein
MAFRTGLGDAALQDFDLLPSDFGRGKRVIFLIAETPPHDALDGEQAEHPIDRSGVVEYLQQLG